MLKVLRCLNIRPQGHAQRCEELKHLRLEFWPWQAAIALPYSVRNIQKL